MNLVRGMIANPKEWIAIIVGLLFAFSFAIESGIMGVVVGALFGVGVYVLLLVIS